MCKISQAASGCTKAVARGHCGPSRPAIVQCMLLAAHEHHNDTSHGTEYIEHQEPCIYAFVQIFLTSQLPGLQGCYNMSPTNKLSVLTSLQRRW